MPRLVIDLESWRITKKEETKKQEVSNNDAEDSYKEEGEKKRQPDNNIWKEGSKPKRRKFERLEGWGEGLVGNQGEMRSLPESWTTVIDVGLDWGHT